MQTDQLLEACLQALSNGQDIPSEIALYLTRHPDQRAEIEELLFTARRASQLPPAELSPASRGKMQARLAQHIGANPNLLAAHNATPESSSIHQQANVLTTTPAVYRTRKQRLIGVGRASLARLLPNATTPPDELAAVRIRTAFRDLTREDIHRYIGIRGEQYLYYRQRFPRWEPVFALIAALLRGFKRLEKLTNLYFS